MEVFFSSIHAWSFSNTHQDCCNDFSPWVPPSRYLQWAHSSTLPSRSLAWAASGILGGHLNRHTSLQDFTIYHTKKKNLQHKLHQWFTQPWQPLARQLCELLCRVPNGLVIVFLAFWWSAKHSVALCTASWWPRSPRSQRLVKGTGGQGDKGHPYHPHQPQHPLPTPRRPEPPAHCREIRGRRGQHMTSWDSCLRNPGQTSHF